MAIAFLPTQVVGRGDLDIFLENSAGNPTNAADIYYALYWVDPGPPESEVLIGSDHRIPVNPAVGEYYASMMVPPSAQIGTYRIRWSFKELSSYPYQQVAQEFAVVQPGVVTSATYDSNQQWYIDHLRMLLRDQCLGGEEEVELDAEGEILAVRLDELWLILQPEKELGDALRHTRDKIRSAFQKGTLKVRSMSEDGCLEWQPVEKVHRNEVPGERILKITVSGTPSTLVVTGGHRIYTSPLESCEAENLTRGRGLMAMVCPDQSGLKRLIWMEKLPPRQFMYDLTVAKNHNLVLHLSGVIVHNCPDKFYHFRPPEFEGDIGQYNRVFGQIWEDAELLEYCERGLDWYNMFPPYTGGITSNLEALTTGRPAWRTAILWAAISHACFALAANWVADEFDYSIGGISLTIEKSSKYESLKQNAESQFDKATEAKARTVKFIRGLQQPRFGIGIRSSFGPFTGRGILSPRSFI